MRKIGKSDFSDQEWENYSINENINVSMMGSGYQPPSHPLHLVTRINQSSKLSQETRAKNLIRSLIVPRSHRDSQKSNIVRKNFPLLSIFCSKGINQFYCRIFPSPCPGPRSSWSRSRNFQCCLVLMINMINDADNENFWSERLNLKP